MTRKRCVILVTRSPEHGEEECEESKIPPGFTLSKHEGLGTRISQSLLSFEMTRLSNTILFISFFPQSMFDLTHGKS